MQQARRARRSDRLHDFVRIGRALAALLGKHARDQGFVARKALRAGAARAR